MNMFLAQVPDDLSNILEGNTSAITKWADKIVDMAIEYAPKLILAVICYLVGKWLIKWTVKLMHKLFKKREFDHSLQTFLVSIVRVSLTILLFLTIINILGVSITSFAALLAGAGLAIGSAMNGSLGNLAGGVMILILKPFRIGDLIEAQDKFGIVTEIGIVYTTILTSQNKTIRLPNGALSTGVITNYTDQENLRIDITFPLLDETDFEKARKVALEAMAQHPRVLKDPAPDVKITALTSDGPVLVLWPRIAIKPYDSNKPRQMEAEYYSVYFGVRQLVYAAFVANDIQTQDLTHQVKIIND